MNDPVANRKKRSLIRRLFFFGGVGSVVIALCFIITYMKAQTRYTVTGPETTDPATGIGIEYTVSSRYTQKRDDAYKAKHGYHDSFADWQYTLPSPSPVIRWLQKHIFPNTNAAPEWEEDTIISLTCSAHGDMANWYGGWHIDSQGYVRIASSHSPRLGAISSVEYRMVGGCPTTLVIEDGDIVVNGHPFQSYCLFVRPPGQSVIYVFQTGGIEGTPPNPALRELKAIREYVRVVKAK